MYEVFNAIAHLCMIILVLEVLVLLVVPAFGIGAGGLFGLNWVRKRMPGWLKAAAPWPHRLLALIDRGCHAAAWPVIRCTSLWRGLKVGVAALRRQAAREG